MTGLQKQLRMTTHSAVYPACAPSVVVAINSPEPTMEAARTMPGPIRRSVARKLTGGSSMAAGSSAYGLDGGGSGATSGAAVLMAWSVSLFLSQLLCGAGYRAPEERWGPASVRAPAARARRASLRAPQREASESLQPPRSANARRGWRWGWGPQRLVN